MDPSKKFQDVSREELARYATNEDLLSQMLFKLHPVPIVALLGDIGQTYAESKEIAKASAQIKIAERAGLHKTPPEHEAVREAIDTATAAIEVAFEAMLNAVMEVNEIQKNCKCANCQQRRQMQNAEIN
jgi:hypothetical protein